MPDQEPLSREEVEQRIPREQVTRARRTVLRRWWWRVLVAVLLSLAATNLLRMPSAVGVGAVGLALDICGVWMLAFAIVGVKNLDLALVGTYHDLQGDTRKPAMLLAREEARFGVAVVSLGFVLQLLGLVVGARGGDCWPQTSVIPGTMTFSTTDYLTFAVVLVTLAYTFYTARMSSLMRAAYLADTRPYLAFDHLRSEHIPTESGDVETVGLRVIIDLKNVGRVLVNYRMKSLRLELLDRVLDNPETANAGGHVFPGATTSYYLPIVCVRSRKS